MKKSILFLSGLLLSFHMSHAGGFKIGMQGVSQLGMGHTGIGFAQDASTIYFNPGGMAYTESQINGGIHLLMPSVSYLNNKTNELTQATSQVFTPFSVYATAKVSPRIHLGIGVYTPFGSGMMYPTDWSGRYILSSISLQSIYVQPTISYRLSDEWSIGAGVVFANGNVNLQKDLPLMSGSEQTIAHATLEGKAKGNGYNVGAYYKPNDKTSFGVTYHSMVKMKVEKGDAMFENVPQALASSFPAKNTFSTELNLPSELGIGFSQKLTARTRFAMDVNYTFWKSFDSLGFDYATNSSQLTDSKSPRLYKNALGFHAGFQTCVSYATTLRIGAFYDQTPVQDGYVAPELPDNNKVGLTAGASFTLHDRVKLDLSCLYEHVAKRSQVNKETGLDGTFKTKVIAPGVGITYLFGKKACCSKAGKCCSKD